MKKIILTLSAIALCSYSYAVKRTVNNNPSYSPGQYTTLAAAITAANANDTLYVVGSPTDYGSVTVSKKLTIIGSGYNPNKQLPYTTSIGSINFSRTLISDPSGSKVMGVSFGAISLSGFDASNTLSNITITRCNVTGDVNLNNYVSSALIYNNIMSRVVSFVSTTAVAGSLSIFNNIIRNHITLTSSANFAGNNLITIALHNNIFIGNGTGTALGHGPRYYVFNNIFYASGTPSGTTYDNCIFSNNLSFATTNNTFFGGGTNSAGNNLVNVNPNFVNVTLATYTVSDDYHLAPGSPALTAGTSGSQIGIYGGAYPFPNGIPSGIGQTGASAPIPQIYEMNMLNPVVPPTTGTLTVEIKARKVD